MWSANVKYYRQKYKNISGSWNRWENWTVANTSIWYYQKACMKFFELLQVWILFLSIYFFAQEEVQKKRTRRAVKGHRAITGASLAEIMAKRNQKPEVRKAQREQAIRWVRFILILYKRMIMIWFSGLQSVDRHRSLACLQPGRTNKQRPVHGMQTICKTTPSPGLWKNLHGTDLWCPKVWGCWSSWHPWLNAKSNIWLCIFNRGDCSLCYFICTLLVTCKGIMLKKIKLVQFNLKI